HRFLGIRLPTPRHHLFKYSNVTPHLLDSLNQSYLWMSPPGKFNDPFECKVLIDHELTEIELAKHLRIRVSKEDVDSLGRIVALKGKRGLAFASRFALDAGEFDPTDIASLNKLFSIVRLARRSSILDERLGVCCFAEDPRNILMWSHYAANHSGVCLRFRY